MENSFKIVQKRATIFVPQNIMYTPDNAAKFKQMLLPKARELQVTNANVPPQIANSLVPQYGMPWQLVDDTHGCINRVVFLPNKIDIVQEKDGDWGSVDVDFIGFCMDKFRALKDEIPGHIFRMAYSPIIMFAINEETTSSDFWNEFLKRTTVKGVPFQNIGLTFLLKRIENINNKDVAINFLHQYSDGYHVTNNKKDADCVLFTLDINTVAEQAYQFEIEDLSDFLSKSLQWTKELIN